MSKLLSKAERVGSTSWLPIIEGGPVEDVSRYHHSESGQDFMRELQADDDERYCILASTPTPAAGVREGNLEPTYWIETKGRLEDVEGFAVSHALKHNQDAVLVFFHDASGPDAEYVLSLPATVPVKETITALRKGGFQGGTIAKGKLIIGDEKAGHRRSAEELARALGAQIETKPGRMNLILRKQYQGIESRYTAAPHSCPPSAYNPASTKEKR